MGKKQKTKDQKIAAAARHYQYVPTYSLSTTQLSPKNVQENIPVSPNVSNVSIVIKDLQKTFFISSLLVLIEIIVFFLRGIFERG